MDKDLNQYGSLFVIFFDFGKAFDTISHELLLHKLKLLGVKGMCSGWGFS